MSELVPIHRPLLELRGTWLIRTAGILAAAVLSVAAPIRAAETITGLMSDGRVITAAIEEGETGFASRPETLAELDADGGAFVDVTAGDGLVYALREDGTVFAVDSSGSVETVSTRGWIDVSRIDFANGELFGLKGGENPVVYNASGLERLRVTGLNVLDFAVHGNGEITLLNQPDPGTWTYTFADGYRGPPTDFVEDGFQTWGARPTPIAIDVAGTFSTVLRSANDGVWWQFKPNLAADPGRAVKNLPDLVGVALNRDQTLAVLMERGRGGIHGAPPVAGTFPVYHGPLGSGTGAGVVFLEDF